MDNASTDGTAEAAEAAWPADAPAPLRVAREPQLGLGHAHMRGFAEARGRLVTWVEDDNWIAPDWLELVSRVMEEHPEVGASAASTSRSARSPRPSGSSSSSPITPPDRRGRPGAT